MSFLSVETRRGRGRTMAIEEGRCLMNSENGTTKLIVGVCMSGVILVLLTLFSFSYQRASQAYGNSVQNRERIAVVETKFDDIKARIDEQRMDIKEMKKTLSEMSGDIQILINRK